MIVILRLAEREGFELSVPAIGSFGEFWLGANIGADCILVVDNNGRRLERNRKFVDSPLEGTGFELLVRGRGEAGCRAF
jgi:hypothetical protein